MPKTYQVTVQTGTTALNIFDGAGTDARVFITLFGSAANTPELPLAAGRAAFEKGSVDQFSVQSVDVGDVREIKLRSDGSGASPAWFVDFVDVDGRRFPVNRLLAGNDLSVFVLPSGPVGRFQNVLDPPSGVALRSNSYEVRLKTADQLSAGTEATISFFLVGRLGISERIQFQGGTSQGETALVVVQTKDIGEIVALQIGHDNSGVGSGWTLESVDVLNTATGNTRHLTANLEIGQPVESLTRYLQAGPNVFQISQLKEPAVAAGIVNGKSSAMFDPIASNADEKRILDTFLNNFRTGAGLDFLTIFTSSDQAPELDSQIATEGDPLFSGADAETWSRVRSELIRWVSQRSFTIAYFQRLRTFIGDLSTKIQGEVSYARDFFSLQNLPTTDDSSQGQVIGATLLALVGAGFSLIGPAETMGVALIAAIISVAQTIPDSLVRGPSGVAGAGTNPLTLTGLGLTVRFNHLIAQLEISRQQILAAALANRSLLNQFTILESDALLNRGQQPGIGRNEQFIAGMLPGILREIWVPYLKFRGALIGELADLSGLGAQSPGLTRDGSALLRLAAQDPSIIEVSSHRHPAYRPLTISDVFVKWSVCLVPLGWPASDGQPARFSSFGLQPSPMEKLDQIFTHGGIAQFFDDNNRTFMMSTLVGSTPRSGTSLLSKSVGSGALFDHQILGPVASPTIMQVPLVNSANFETATAATGEVFSLLKKCQSPIGGNSECAFYIRRSLELGSRPA